MKGIFCFIIFSFSTIGALSQQWTTEDKEVFVSNCVPEAEDSMAPSASRQYCYCFLDWLMGAYPDPNDVDQLTEEEVNNTAVRCLEYQNNWSQQDQDQFMASCEREASSSMGEDGALNYCSCMLYKLTYKFPTTEGIDQMTEEEIDNMARECLF